MFQTAKRPWLTTLIVWLSVLAVVAVMMLAGGIAMAVIAVESGRGNP